mgnify:CR=1 FL=1
MKLLLVLATIIFGYLYSYVGKIFPKLVNLEKSVPFIMFFVSLVIFSVLLPEKVGPF